MLNRRNLIALSISLTASIALGVGLSLYAWWDAPPDQPYRHLNNEEASMIRHLSGAAFPAGDFSPLRGDRAHLDRFFDLFIENMETTNRNLLRFFLHTLNQTTLIHRQKRFVELVSGIQTQQLESWLSVDHPLFRNAVQSLVAILGMGYTTHPEVSPLLNPLHRCGYG
ncbi:MAG: hypothetical protein VX278_10145 [Myxococcota bacterium]|nr:hypothetical protein [Myxococcota bacterium]